MPLILVDGQGVVLATDGADWPAPLPRPFAAGTRLLEPLAALALAGDGSAHALRALLDDVLQRRAERGDSALPAGWRARVRRVAEGGLGRAWLQLDCPPGLPAAPASPSLPTGQGAGGGSWRVPAVGVDAGEPDDEVAALRAALQAAERRLDVVQSVAALGTWHVDLASGRSRFSPETYRILGLDPARGPLRSAVIRERVHPDDLPRLLADRTRAYAGEPLVASLFRFFRGDGDVRWLETRVSHEAAAPGCPAGIFGTVRDVTDTVQTRQDLDRHRDRLEELVVSRTVQLAEASERAEAASRAKSAFLAHTSHEIRTPLNVIVSLAHLMHHDAAGTRQHTRVQAIEQAARHLSSIIDDVLDLARNEARVPGVQPVPVHPDLVLAEAAVMLRPQAQRQGVQIEVDANAAAGPWPPLRGDTARLRQALLNGVRHVLVGATDGRVVLRATLLADHADAGGDCEQLPVPAKVPWLRFEIDGPSSATPAADADVNRTSLQRLVTLLGGQAGVLRLDDGTRRCWFTAQVTTGDGVPDVAAAAGNAAEQLRQRHAGRRVLLAEDDDVSQMAMVELLSDAGLLVDTADDGREAVDMASRRPYALILLDLRMPRLDGVAAARTIRTLPGHQGTPLVAVTANAFIEDREACRAAGMSDFLPKPVDVPRLYALLLHWLDAAPHVGTAWADGSRSVAAWASPTAPPAWLTPRPVLAVAPLPPPGLAAPAAADHGSRPSPWDAPHGPSSPGPAGLVGAVGPAQAAALHHPPQAAAAQHPAAASDPGHTVSRPPVNAPGAALAGVTTADAMAPLLGLEGVDAAGGLASVGGKPAVYRRLLSVFGSTHDGDAAQAQRLLADGDGEAVGRLAHRLRGSAATLGLIDIETAAAALEGALDDGAAPTAASTAELAQALAEALDGTLQRLREALLA